eukprot:m.164767 g.164767  ORF g.164767 m.164767 type:complete len:92 (-) comp23965_c0_seq2:511-786(-)
MARQAGAELAALDLSGVPLLAVTYDPDVTRAAEWRDTGFKHAIPGHVFLDTERAFYSGATQSGVQAFLRYCMAVSPHNPPIVLTSCILDVA